jgi:hypothetical protein
MRAALVGLPYSGKTTLFAAVAEAGGSSVHLERPDQEHLATVKVPDERLAWLEQVYEPKKRTHAEIEFLDVPGLDLTTEASRQRSRQHWVAVRQSDMLVIVLRAFESDAAPPYRDRVDPAADLEELRSEMLFSDLEQVAARVEKLEKSVKKPTPDRDMHLRELELMRRMQEALENERPLTEAVRSAEEEKMVRAFAFLTLKPALVVLNVDEDRAGRPGPDEHGGLPALQLSAKIEEEIASLDPGDRAEFLQEMGLSEVARDRLIRKCYESMNLISFLTVGPDEVRAWTIPAGTTAVEAAEEIHSDIARGFIRAEVISYEDLRAVGSEKAARAAGKHRLEGKDYVVRDGDVILFRFNV